MGSIPQRQCKHCLNFFDPTPENFYTFRNRQGGLSLRHTCKQCFDANAKKNYRQRLEENPDYERDRYKRRMEENPEQIRATNRARYWRDPDKYNAYQQEYRDENRDKIRAQKREAQNVDALMILKNIRLMLISTEKHIQNFIN